MNLARDFSIVLVTAPDIDCARTLAREVLQSGLAACANLLPGVESHYWWKGQLETSSEVLLLIKTSRTLLERLEKLVLSKHPYDTPEILEVGLASGTARYLEWLAASAPPV